MAIVGAAMLGIFLVLVIFGKSLISALVGDEYVIIYALMLWLGVGGLITTITFPLEPMLISAGNVRGVVLTRLIGMVVFLIGFHTFVLRYELDGAGIATAISGVVTSGLLWLFSRKMLTTRS